VLGLRPEHLTETHAHAEPGTPSSRSWSTSSSRWHGDDGLRHGQRRRALRRVDPRPALQAGDTMPLPRRSAAHALIDPVSDRVIEVPPDCRGDSRLNDNAAKLRVG